MKFVDEYRDGSAARTLAHLNRLELHDAERSP